MHMFRLILTGVCAAVLGLAAGASAAAEKAVPAQEETVIKSETASNAPFMKPLGRLATILGSVHFLRELCGDEAASVWRERMDDLLKAQAPNAADREILIAGFNSGYRAYASVYRRCTPAARVAVARHQEEGSALSRDIAARYGN